MTSASRSRSTSSGSIDVHDGLAVTTIVIEEVAVEPGGGGLAMWQGSRTRLRAGARLAGQDEQSRGVVSDTTANVGERLEMLVDRPAPSTTRQALGSTRLPSLPNAMSASIGDDAIRLTEFAEHFLPNLRCVQETVG